MGRWRWGAQGCGLLECQQKELSFLKDATPQHFTTTSLSPEIGNLFCTVADRNWVGIFMQKSQTPQLVSLGSNVSSGENRAIGNSPI